jgi:toxin HigB-1
VIETFRHAGLKRYFMTGNPKGIPFEMVDRIRIRLNVLNRAKELRDVNLPGLGFHPLKGDRKGEFAVVVTRNYRITFKFRAGEVFDVNLEDYH